MQVFNKMKKCPCGNPFEVEFMHQSFCMSCIQSENRRQTTENEKQTIKPGDIVYHVTNKAIKLFVREVAENGLAAQCVSMATESLINCWIPPNELTKEDHE